MRSERGSLSRVLPANAAASTAMAAWHGMVRVGILVILCVWFTQGALSPRWRFNVASGAPMATARVAAEEQVGVWEFGYLGQRVQLAQRRGVLNKRPAEEPSTQHPKQDLLRQFKRWSRGSRSEAPALTDDLPTVSVPGSNSASAAAASAAMAAAAAAVELALTAASPASTPSASAPMTPSISPFAPSSTSGSGAAVEASTSAEAQAVAGEACTPRGNTHRENAGSWRAHCTYSSPPT